MTLAVIPTELPDVLLVRPTVYGDARGFFFESYNERDFAVAIGQARTFVQDNHSRSSRGVVRGIHYQVVRPQGKLVRVTAGEIFDVAVDLRRSSRTFGRWSGAVLSAENQAQMWIPEGFGHGFMVTSAVADVLYKTTEYWSSEHECAIAWDDPALAISWPELPPILSEKDIKASRLSDAALFD